MSSAGRSRPRQHESGDFGERLFAALLPPQLVVHSYKGTEDYGVDFHVEVFSGGNPTGLEFGAQVRTLDAWPDRATVPSVTLKVSSLLYMAVKPYPIMLAIISRSDKNVRFAWLSDLLPPSEFVRQVRSSGDRRGRLRLRLTPNLPLDGASDRIEHYLRERRAALVAWINDATHQRQLADLYFYLHAVLDALIECGALREKASPPADEVLHKTTFTLIMVLMTYRTLHGLTPDVAVTSLGPSALALLAIRKNLRKLLVSILPERDVAYLETHPDEAHLAPYTLEPLWPALTPLVCLFRDGLATLAHFLAPWRDFNTGHSGLARTVIEYHGEASHMFKRAESGQDGA